MRRVFADTSPVPPLLIDPAVATQNDIRDERTFLDMYLEVFELLDSSGIPNLRDAR
ncbi:hypothetical protein BS17DRAFT_786143 [Gyrodon lividus]|nr:hypothetical protein BS17DRAFT_786143 [Gyrodon lividus]